jgi:ABC-2 type transport system ATP-binding protein
MEDAVVLEGVSRSFGPVQAVDGLTLTIRTGETVALLGPNGAGKSTAIGLLLGLLAPDGGRVAVGGRDPRAAVAAGGVGAMLQDAGLMPGVRVGELLTFVRGLFPKPLPVRDLVETAGLGAILDRRVDRLSGGQAQRVRFAMAIAGDPALIVLDEPTAAMDVEARRAFWERMGTFARDGKTILFATHYLEEADMAAERIVVIAGGRRVADGTAAEIKATVGERRVRFTLREGDEDVLESLDGVGRVERHGRRATLYTRDADATVRQLVAADLAWEDLEVEGADLESAFLTLTGGV